MLEISKKDEIYLNELENEINKWKRCLKNAKLNQDKYKEKHAEFSLLHSQIKYYHSYIFILYGDWEKSNDITSRELEYYFDYSKLYDEFVTELTMFFINKDSVGVE